MVKEPTFMFSSVSTFFDVNIEFKHGHQVSLELDANAKSNESGQRTVRNCGIELDSNDANASGCGFTNVDTVFVDDIEFLQSLWFLRILDSS